MDSFDVYTILNTEPEDDDTPNGGVTFSGETEETIVCVICGHKTMTGTRSKYNGHFHGCCKCCGAVIME